MSFYREKNIKAIRKEHCCYGCGKLIGIGNPAIYYSGQYDGEFYYGYSHHVCKEITSILRERNDWTSEEGISPGELWDYAREHNASSMEELLVNLKEYASTQVPQ